MELNMKTYKYMYSISYKKPNEYANFVTYTGGNTEEEAKANAIRSALEFHNKYNAIKLTESDFTIVECKLSGDYNSVLKELERG
jgi:hypothetical protein